MLLVSVHVLPELIFTPPILVFLAIQDVQPAPDLPSLIVLSVLHSLSSIKVEGGVAVDQENLRLLPQRLRVKIVTLIVQLVTDQITTIASLATMDHRLFLVAAGIFFF